MSFAALLLTIASASSAVATDEAVMRAALNAVSSANEEQCLVATLTPAPFADLRHEMVEYARDAGKEVPGPEARAAVVRQANDSWPRWDMSGPVDRPTSTRIKDAAVAIMEKSMDAKGRDASKHRTRSSAILRRLLAPNQRLLRGDQDDCVRVTLSAVSRHGDLAFIEVGKVWGPLNGVGEIYAFVRSDAGWTPIARQRTWVS